MVKNFFLDTNVIIHYIIYEQLLKRKESIDKGTPSHQRYEAMHKLVKKIIEFKDDTHMFFISLLVRAEFYYALFEEHKCREMYKGGIPLSSWQINKNKVKFKDDFLEDINLVIFEFEKNIEDAGKKKKKKIWSSWDVYNYGFISWLAYKYNIKSHDAILLSTAIFNRCKYFVTSDKRLRDKFEKEKFIIEFDKRKIELIDPGKAFEIIQKVTSSSQTTTSRQN